MRFSAIIYNEEGKILSSVRNATALSMEGKTYIEADVSGDLEDHYVDNGALQQKPEKPSDFHEFDYQTKQWAINIEDAKAQRWSDLKLDREDQEFGYFIWNGWEFDADADSQVRIQTAVQSAILDDAFTTTWTLRDNTTQALTAAQLKELGKALSDHIKAAHDHGRILRSQIESATTVQELEAISW
jgi:hypothetical protein